MSYPHITAKIVADSLNPMAGTRLCTFELTYPRFIHAEVMTHRMLSRNAQSSRAIPTAKRIDAVRNNPVMPILWRKNKRGMQAENEAVDSVDACCNWWEFAARRAAAAAAGLRDAGLHKQWANRVLEPFDTITVVVSGTEFENFFGLRCAPDAQPEMQCLAWRMAELYYEVSKPKVCHQDWAHLPYIDDRTLEKCSEMSFGFELPDLIAVSVGRCARVSYLGHDGVEKTIEEELAFYEGLRQDFHLSAFEHVAMPMAEATFGRGNFRGWLQHRHQLAEDTKTFKYDPSARPVWTA